jgi:hypothetical protein
MQRIEYRTIDTAAWGDGPWATEPDKIQWQDEVTGYPCLIVRSPEMGFLCGYVGVPANHPFHGQHYDKPDVSVHHGLTFSGGCHGEPEAESVGICHKTDPGEPDDVWWFGFDCMHLWDFPPGYKHLIGREWPTGPGGQPNEYRDVPYVTAECQSLAKQLKAMEG